VIFKDDRELIGDPYTVSMTKVGPQDVDKIKSPFCDDDDTVTVKVSYELK